MIDERINNFVKKISTYDKANWEIIVENYRSRSNLCDIKPKPPKSDRRQLIDIDLFRGKPFQKAKPIYDWTSITIKAFFRILFYPFYSSWWIDQLDYFTFLLFLGMYILQLTTILIYLLNKDVSDNFSFMEANSFIFITFIVGEIYNHVIARNLTLPRHPSKINSLTEPPNTGHTFELSPIRGTLMSKSTENLLKRVSKRKNLKNDFSENLEVNSDHGSRPPSGTFESINAKEVHTDDETVKMSQDQQGSQMMNESASILTHSSLSLSDTEQKDEIFDDPVEIVPQQFDKSILDSKGHIQEEVIVTFFKPHRAVKAKISIWEIVEIIEERVNDLGVKFNLSAIFTCVCLLFALLPYFFKVSISMATIDQNTYITSMIFSALYEFIFCFRRYSFIVNLEMIFVVIIRFIMLGCFLFLLFVAEKTYRLRYLYAKYFGALTSSRLAKRNQLPHFRLHKVKNIKAWLSLRSYLRRCGPIRSIDLVVSCTFYLSIVFIILVCLKFLFDMNYQKSEVPFMEEYLNWEIPAWAILISSFLLRFLSLGAEVNRKYNNNTELLTEQINLYLHMEIFPHKKEEYVVANNVLKLASKLIKEIESPQKVTNFIMNPLLRNITRVVILSLISGVISEIFGVSFKFWKIKAM